MPKKSFDFHEPWHTTAGIGEGAYLASTNGYVPLITPFRQDAHRDKNTGGATPEAMEYARRIKVCINACAGLPTEALEKLEPGDLRRHLLNIVTYMADEEEDFENDQRETGDDPNLHIWSDVAPLASLIGSTDKPDQDEDGNNRCTSGERF